VRLFVALDLPQQVRARLARLAAGLPGARWPPPENYHLTLRFLGEMPAHRAEELDGALAALRGRGFVLQISGVGVFEKAGRPQTLWAGVERNADLARLQSKVETALHRVGLAPDRRRFTPHVTLARMDQPVSPGLASFVVANNLYRSAPIRADNVTLFSSFLGKDQPTYTPEAEYALG